MNDAQRNMLLPCVAAKPLLKWYIELIASTLVTSNKNGAQKNWKRTEVQKCERGGITYLQKMTTALAGCEKKST